MVELFETDRTRAKDALFLAQKHQWRAYNKGRLIDEFEEGQSVAFNFHSLKLVQEEEARG